METVWSQAAWETLECTGSVGWQRKTNLARLYAMCLFKHTSYYACIIDSWKSARKKGIKGVSVARVFKELAVVLFEAAYVKMKRLMRPSASNGQTVLATVEDVCYARNELDKFLDAHRATNNITMSAE